MKHYVANVAIANESEIPVAYTIKMKHNTRFILNECYLTIKKDLFQKKPESDYFIIEIVSDECENKIIPEIYKEIQL